MAKLKPQKAGKVGHGNLKQHKDIELLHRHLKTALPKGSGARGAWVASARIAAGRIRRVGGTFSYR